MYQLCFVQPDSFFELKISSPLLVEREVSNNFHFLNPYLRDIILMQSGDSPNGTDIDSIFLANEVGKFTVIEGKDGKKKLTLGIGVHEEKLEGAFLLVKDIKEYQTDGKKVLDISPFISAFILNENGYFKTRHSKIIIRDGVLCHTLHS